MKMTRRHLVLGGLGGALLGLPWLESLRGRSALAQSAAAPPFAIFFRQANGVAAEQDTSEIGQEPERFWPTATGPLSAETLSDRAGSHRPLHAPGKRVVTAGVEDHQPQFLGRFHRDQNAVE